MAVLPPFIDIGSRITGELNNPKYDAGEVSYYAKDPEGGSRTGGSNSSAENGQGGQGADGNSIFNIIIDFIVDIVTLEIFTEEELKAPVYKTEEVVVYADREQVLPEANWWDYIQNGLTWDRTVNIGGTDYSVDRRGYAFGMRSPSSGTPPDVGIGVVGKAGKLINTFKHSDRGFGSIFGLSDEVAKTVFENSIQIGRRRFGYYNKKIYQFMDGNDGTWHGFVGDYTDDVVKQAIDIFKKNKIIDSKTAKRLRGGK